MQIRAKALRSCACVSRSQMCRSLMLLVGTAPFIDSSSNGDGAACLDALTLCTHPCPPDEGTAMADMRPWASPNADGVLYPCCPPGMDLVAPPTRSADYELTVSPPGPFYAPCELVTVAIDVLSPTMKYLGLLLYAVVESSVGAPPGQEREVRVGSWSVPPGDQERFWASPGCNGTAIMHANAGVKHLHHEFKLRAPPAGTGPIRIRAMVKRGETLGGAFHWVGEEDVVIDEGATPTTAWVRAPTGVACSAACQHAQLGECDGTAMVQAATRSGAAQIEDGPGRFVTCREPLVSDNNNGESCHLGGGALLQDPLQGWCSFRDDGICPLVDSDRICDEPPGVLDRSWLCACSSHPAVNEVECPVIAGLSVGLETAPEITASDTGTGILGAAAVGGAVCCILLGVATRKKFPCNFHADADKARAKTNSYDDGGEKKPGPRGFHREQQVQTASLNNATKTAATIHESHEHSHPHGHPPPVPQRRGPPAMPPRNGHHSHAPTVPAVPAVPVRSVVPPPLPERP